MLNPNKNLLSDIKIARRKTTQDSINSTLEPTITSQVDFEKMILRDPNNCKTWIQYISFMQQSEGLTSSRKTAERGLRIINFRDDDSKLNVWKAFINIEFYFGNDSSCSDLFKRGLAANDPFAMIKHMIFLYKSKNDWEMSEEFVKLF